VRRLHIVAAGRVRAQVVRSSRSLLLPRTTHSVRRYGSHRSAAAALAIRVRYPCGYRADMRHSRICLRLQESRAAAVCAALLGLRRGPETFQEAWQDP